MKNGIIIILTLVVLVSNFSCDESCEKWRNGFRQFSFFIIVEKCSNNGNKYWIQGWDKEGKPHSMNGASSDISRTVPILLPYDTLVKDSGTLRFYVRRKGRVIPRVFWCGDTTRFPIDSLKPRY